jgi:hypothetical protein
MLTHLKLENFKIWRSTGPIRLAPITLLLGTNSSGKSSLIQSLLLIRQTVNGDDPNLDLNLGNPDADDSVTLGQFKDLLCHHGAASESTSATQVGIEFRWSERGQTESSSLFSARYNKGPAGSAELAFLRLGKDGQGFSVQRRKPGIYKLTLARKGSHWAKVQIFARSVHLPFQRPLSTSWAQGGIDQAIGPALLDELAASFTWARCAAWHNATMCGLVACLRTSATMVPKRWMP